jgi:hypothetical protein
MLRSKRSSASGRDAVAKHLVINVGMVYQMNEREFKRFLVDVQFDGDKDKALTRHGRLLGIITENVTDWTKDDINDALHKGNTHERIFD